MRELRLLHAADLHLDPPFESMSPEKAERRRAGRRALLFSLVRTAREKGARALILAGDVFDGPDVSPDTVRDFRRALDEIDMPVIALTGNHDPYTPDSPWARMSPPENLYLFSKNQFEALEFPALGVRFWGAGFEDSFCPPLLRDFAPPERREGLFEVLVLHGDLTSSGSDYCPMTRAELERSGVDYAALGHIHNRSPLERAGKVFWAYPGCIEGGGYDETGEKGAYLVTLRDGGVDAEFIPLDGPRYEVITLDLTGREPLEAADEAISELSERDYCRLILRGELREPPDISRLRRALEGRLAELQLRDETELERDIWAAAGRDSLEGVFLSRLKAMLEAAPTDRERKKIELAARYGTAALERGGPGL